MTKTMMAAILITVAMGCGTSRVASSEFEPPEGEMSMRQREVTFQGMVLHTPVGFDFMGPGNGAVESLRLMTNALNEHGNMVPETQVIYVNELERDEPSLPTDEICASKFGKYYGIPGMRKIIPEPLRVAGRVACRKVVSNGGDLRVYYNEALIVVERNRFIVIAYYPNREDGSYLREHGDRFTAFIEALEFLEPVDYEAPPL